MKIENKIIQEYCLKRDWDGANNYLHKSKASLKAYRRIEKL